MNDLIPESFEDLEELREYDIIPEKEYHRLFQILLDRLLTQSSTSSNPSKSDNLGVLGVVAPGSSQEPLFKEGTTETTEKDGIITRVRQYIDQDGQKTRVVTKLRRIKKTVNLPRCVFERRKLVKFGKCKDLPKGPEPGITSIGDEVMLVLTNKNQEECLDKKQVSVTGSKISCRNCGEPGHWTMHCPHKQNTETTDDLKLIMMGEESSGKYVPPSRRKNQPRYDSSIQETKTNIKLSNLDENATDDDLKFLFGKFGALKRVRVITDRETHISRGFAFIEFEDEESAQKAMDTLHRYAYGQQILELTWAKPRRR